MNTENLKKRLKGLKINEESYSLEGGLPNERYCLDESYGTWSFYYSERGQKTGYVEFDSEKKACEYFLDTIKKDNSVFT